MNTRTMERMASDAAGPRWHYRHRGYAMSRALGQLSTRRMASAMTLLVLGIALALPILLLFVSVPLYQLANRSLDGESLTLYLDPGHDRQAATTLAESIEQRSDVQEIRFISAEEALETLRLQSDLGDAVDALGINPLPAAIIVFPDRDRLSSTATVADSVAALGKELGDLPGVERVELDLIWVRRLQAVVELVQIVGGLLGAFLLLTALLVIGNTIRLELLRRQREQEVAALLGATRVFLNRPLLYIGALYGLLGGLIGTLFALLAFLLIRRPVLELASLYNSGFSLAVPDASLAGLVLLVCTFLGLAGAAMALYRSSMHLFPRRSN